MLFCFGNLIAHSDTDIEEILLSSANIVVVLLHGQKQGVLQAVSNYCSLLVTPLLGTVLFYLACQNMSAFLRSPKFCFNF